jgi:hypothetical protein
MLYCRVAYLPTVVANPHRLIFSAFSVYTRLPQSLSRPLRLSLDSASAPCLYLSPLGLFTQRR